MTAAEQQFSRERSDAATVLPRALDADGPERPFSPKELARRLNVLFIVSKPISTPAITVHANLMRYLNRDRVAVHVVYNRLASAEPYVSSGKSVLDVLPDDPDVRLRPANFGPVGDTPKGELLRATAGATGPAVRDVARLLRYIRRQKIDVIYCDEGSRNAFLGLWLARVARIKSVVHFHSKYGNWIGRVSRTGVERADAIIAVSAWTGRGIQMAGVPSDRIFPVLNGIDLSRWDAAADGGQVRREFSLAPEQPLVVCVAQLTHFKRQKVLVEAFAEVVKTHPEARLLLAGVEWNPDASKGGSYTEQLHQMVGERRLGEQVIFAGQRRDVPQLLAAADIFSLPSVGEPCGLAVIEAMAMGRAIVGVRDGGPWELVEHGKAGLLGAPDDSAELARNLVTLIDDPHRRRQLGEFGRRHARQYLTAQRMADEVEAVLRFTVCAR